MPTVAETLQRAERQLAAVSDSPRLDAEILLAHAIGATRAHVLACLGESAPEGAFEALVARRAAGEPIAYILGSWEFFSLEFEVERPALVPRPETEHLVEAVLDFIGSRPAGVLDLCTGTGCVAVAIAKNAPGARILATDLEPRYVDLARRNVARHGLSDRVRVAAGDLFAAVPAGEPPFDAVCANPPYIAEAEWAGLSETIRRYEDPAALIGGSDGLDCVRRIVAAAPRYLRPGGLLAIEIGHGQAWAVRNLLEAGGFLYIEFRRDLAGIERIACGHWPE
jgi:release factor glutamine methyltransferase